MKKKYVFTDIAKMEHTMLITLAQYVPYNVFHANLTLTVRYARLIMF